MAKKNPFAASLVILILSILPSMAFGFAGGDGSAENPVDYRDTGDGSVGAPFEISTAEHLYQMHCRPQDYDKHFRLMADIDMADFDTDTNTPDIIEPYTTAVIAPLGGGRVFSGSFDGNGFAIKNLYIAADTSSDDDSCKGLFGFVIGHDASISNLGIEDAQVNGHNYIAALAGRIDYAKVSNCYVTAQVSGHINVAPLAGFHLSNTITNCYARGSASGDLTVGGLLGAVEGGAIRNCYAATSINITSQSSYKGGLAGTVEARTEIANCFWDRDVAGVSASYKGWSNGGINNYIVYSIPGKVESKVTWLMKTMDTFIDAGWDFVYETANGQEYHWYMPSSDYPLLSCQSQAVLDYFSVTFDLGEHGILERGDLQQMIKYGQDAFAPVFSMPLAWEFAGWDTDFTNVVETLTVTAQYQPAYYTVTFCAGENGTISDGQVIQEVRGGSGADEPQVEADTGWDFIGWDAEFDCITSDINVNALYEQWELTVTFNAGDWGSIVSGESVQTVFYGQAAIAPVIDPAGGWIFTGWDTEFDNVTNDITINAVYTAAPFDGLGTEDMPYKIATVYDLDNVNLNLNAHYLLVDDIDLSSIVYEEAVIAPSDLFINLSFNGPPFNGTFNGNNKTISNLTIKSTDTVQGNYGFFGLFGCIAEGACIYNLTLDNVDITLNGSVAGSLAGENRGTVEGCYTRGSILHKYDCVGGLVGINSGTINRCSSSGLISSMTEESDVRTSSFGYGGLVGHNYGGMISQSYSSCQVNGIYDCGGLLGVNSCYGYLDSNSGTYLWSIGTVTDCYSAGNVSGWGIAGGFVGTSNGEIYNCYSTGDVWNSHPICDINEACGGFVGINNENRREGSIEESFWDIDRQTHGVVVDDGYRSLDLAGVTALDTSNMTLMSTFTDASWDFVGETTNGTGDIWKMMNQRAYYPLLSWQQEYDGDIAGDYGIDFADFAEFAANWQTIGCYCFDDLLNIAENWLVGK